VVIIAAGVASGCGSTAEDANHRASDCAVSAFDKAKWRAPGSRARSSFLGRASVRQKMADQLVACRKLYGLRRSEIRALLGKPYPENRFNLYYELGDQRSGGNLDSEFLRVHFDRRSRVADVAIEDF
jgi:hypothetical protein